MPKAQTILRDKGDLLCTAVETKVALSKQRKESRKPKLGGSNREVLKVVLHIVSAHVDYIWNKLSRGVEYGHVMRQLVRPGLSLLVAHPTP